MGLDANSIFLPTKFFKLFSPRNLAFPNAIGSSKLALTLKGF